MGKKYLSAGIVLGFLAWFGWIMLQTPGRKQPEPAPPTAPPTPATTAPLQEGTSTPLADTSAPAPVEQPPPAEVVAADTPPAATATPVPTASPTDIPASVAAGPASIPNPSPAAPAKTLVEPKTDLPALIKSAQDVTGPTTPALKALQGAYEGQLPTSEFNKEPWTIEMRNQWTDDGSGRYTADYEILLTGAGAGSIARTTGTGNFKGARSTGDDGGLLIEVSPDMFMHLFYEPQTDDFTGTFYSMDASGVTRVHGKVVLTRK